MLNKFKFFVTSLFKIRFLENLLVSNFVQKSRFNWFIIRKVAPRRFQYEPKTLKKATRNGINYELDLSQHIDYSIFFGLTTDSSRRKLYELATKSTIIIDIGTNIGEVVLNFARILDNKGKVYGFEPNNHSFQKLQKNISLNNFNCIEIMNYGLSHNNENFELSEVIPENAGANRILAAKTTNIPSQTIQTMRFDDFVSNKQITNIDLIKIDVEGFEYFVLQGAKATLEKYKPKLFIELIDKHLKVHGFSARILVDFLDNLGYKSYNADTNIYISKNYDLENCIFDIYSL